MNDLLKEVWTEAGRRQASCPNNQLNLKLFASSFFMLGMAVSSLENSGLAFKEALTKLNEIEQKEKTIKMTGLERMEARVNFLANTKQSNVNEINQI
jgi:hypothetical protein